MLSIFQGAPVVWAANLDVAAPAACGVDLGDRPTPAPTIALALPDITVVDGDDPDAILLFMDAVVAFPPGRRPHALTRTFETLWSAYRPDLGESEIHARVDAFNFSIFALRKLRSSEPAKLDAWRLMQAWRRFVEDYVDRHAKTSSAATRALGVAPNPTAILAFLDSEFPGVVGPGGTRTQIYFRKLYARDLPSVTPPDSLKPRDHHVTGPGARPRNHRVLTAWRTYLKDLTGTDADGPSDPPPVRRSFRTKMVAIIPERPEDVANDVKSIIAFLVARYRTIRINQLDAAAGYVRELRKEYGLPAKLYPFKRDDLRLAFYADRESSRALILKAWQEFREDVARSRASSAVE